MVLIYLDAGHGGKDSGAIGNGIKEKDINLKLAKKIQDELKNYPDVKVIVSRDTDIYLTLKERTDRANAAKADYLISLHLNSAENKAAKGFESYIYHDTGQPTRAFQNVMHQEIIAAIDGKQDDRGKKQANFHMLRESNMVAILTENLFVSSSSDAALLKQDTFLDKIALGHVKGLEKFIGLKRIEKPPEQKTPQGKLYYVQVGAFEEKKNAEALVSDLLKEGYRPMIKYQ